MMPSQGEGVLCIPPSLPHLDPGVLLDEVPLPPLLALGPLGVHVVRGEGGQLRSPPELGAGLAVARGQLGVAPEKLAGWKTMEEHAGLEPERHLTKN